VEQPRYSIEHAIRGFHGVTLMLDEGAPTAALLTDVLRFSEIGHEGGVRRFRANEGRGGVVEIREAKGISRRTMGRGSVHHIAFRAADDAEQAALARKAVEDHGVRATEQKDRKYFRSVYFREPGGVLFEIATDQPGFAVDEPVESLGHDLKLPAFLEPRRKTSRPCFRRSRWPPDEREAFVRPSLRAGRAACARSVAASARDRRQ
jgi:Lactoylglutathione lyase and related lyases